jgi:hypothetical protein
MEDSIANFPSLHSVVAGMAHSVRSEIGRSIIFTRYCSWSTRIENMVNKIEVLYGRYNIRYLLQRLHWLKDFQFLALLVAK